jgi:hypothetical protein
MVRASPGHSNGEESQATNPSDRGISAQHDLDFDNDGAGYGLTQDRDNKAEVPVTATWVPLRGRDQPRRSRINSRTRNASSGAASDLLDRIQTREVDLPGPFFSWSAFLYIFLYPTWARWLGLSLVCFMSAGVLGVTLFVSWIVIRFQLFLSVFAISAMAMLNLALISYVVACFVEVIEETAAGEDRLQQLVDMSWWDILPRFFRVIGAAAVAIAIAWALTAPLKYFLPGNSAELRITRLACWLQLFPVLLIANLVDSTVIPFRSLVGTLRRLAAKVGCFAAFQTFALLLSVLALVTLAASYKYHWVAGWLVAGPFMAAWTLYYGHWLGRLCRQLADVG